MLLIDVITTALPALTRHHAKAHRGADPDVGPHIGVTWFQLAGRVQVLKSRFEYPSWISSRSNTLGITGMNSIGLAVARDASASRASIIYYHSGPVAEAESTCAARLVSLEKVLLADVVCVALPWADRAEGLLRALDVDRVASEAIFIAWLRSPAVERALAHLSENYAERVELQELAVIACMSKFHFVRAFTAILGVTPHRYQLLLRLAKAKAMLGQGSEIAQVAAHAGFWDQSHFDRSFRLFVGMTPTQYQQNALA
jgi:AraC-like DNA-binding protein